MSRKTKESKMIRERAERYGVDALMDWEVLSLITNVKVDVLQQFKSFHELRERVDMLEITNLQKQKLKAIFDVSTRITKEEVGNINKITGPQDVANLLMSDMRYLKKEEFRIILLDTKNQVIGTKTVSIGSLNASIVHPREVFKEAILHSSASIILAHNHPSGDSAPSKEDISITKRLVEAGNLVGIQVLDHIIIGNGKYTSLKEEQII